MRSGERVALGGTDQASLLHVRERCARVAKDAAREQAPESHPPRSDGQRTHSSRSIAILPPRAATQIAFKSHSD